MRRYETVPGKLFHDILIFRCVLSFPQHVWCKQEMLNKCFCVILFLSERGQDDIINRGTRWDVENGVCNFLLSPNSWMAKMTSNMKYYFDAVARVGSCRLYCVNQIYLFVRCQFVCLVKEIERPIVSTLVRISIENNMCKVTICYIFLREYKVNSISVSMWGDSPLGITVESFFCSWGPMFVDNHDFHCS